ncbi:helix-turn-helix domain protein [Coprobacillus sp. CAG:826]|nr:helix-turn-helix domain protein [Coprobacillus sp. CAG:826]
MEKEELYLIVAKNISDLRRAAGMTQLDLADKIHYSDKTVSKWERGEAIPDAETIILLAEVFGVTSNEILYKPMMKKVHTSKKELFTWNHYFITLISICIPYLVLAICMFFVGTLEPSAFKEWWLPMLLYGVSVSFIVWLVFASLWWPSLWQQIVCSGLVWSIAVSIHLTFSNIMILLIYGIAGVLQIAIFFWWLLKKSIGIKREKWRFLPKKVEKINKN